MIEYEVVLAADKANFERLVNEKRKQLWCPEGGALAFSHGGEILFVQSFIRDELARMQANKMAREG